MSVIHKLCLESAIMDCLFSLIKDSSKYQQVELIPSFRWCTNVWLKCTIIFFFLPEKQQYIAFYDVCPDPHTYLLAVREGWWRNRTVF
ncbi:hypothetical protein FKM82_007167 [Ascaphus truei]